MMRLIQFFICQTWQECVGVKKKSWHVTFWLRIWSLSTACAVVSVRIDRINSLSGMSDATFNCDQFFPPLSVMQLSSISRHGNRSKTKRRKGSSTLGFLNRGPRPPTGTTNLKTEKARGWYQMASHSAWSFLTVS